MCSFRGVIGRFRIHSARILPGRRPFRVEAPGITHGAKILPALSAVQASPFGRAGQGHVLWILALSLGAEGNRRGGRLAWKAMGRLAMKAARAEGDGAAGRGGLAGDEAGWPIGAIGTEGDRGGRRVDVPSARKAIKVDGERRSSCCLPLYLNN